MRNHPPHHDDRHNPGDYINAAVGIVGCIAILAFQLLRQIGLI